MPVFHGNLVRVTAAEQGRLLTQARRHGRAHAVPTEIRTTAELETARYHASGARLLEDLEEYIEQGSSPATRGEIGPEELFGEPSSV